jgi:dienelactone hydrolase
MLFAQMPEQVFNRLVEYIVKSGRAIVLPAYAGTLERGPTALLLPPGKGRDIEIMQFKDAARSIDYLETRSDIDASKVGYVGLSFGVVPGTVILGGEPRFKTGVFISGGRISAPILPEVAMENYLPRIKIPILMLNGEDDAINPVELSQKPFFNALGTPEKDKRYIAYPGGHVDFIERMEVIKEMLNWLDRYLGTVKK